MKSRLFGLVLIIITILMISIACWGYPKPSMQLIIENQTKQELTIYYGEVKLGNVGSLETITGKNIDRLIGEYLIEAKNAQGVIVFSQIFTWETMQEMEGGEIYKIIIPPLE